MVRPAKPDFQFMETNTPRRTLLQRRPPYQPRGTLTLTMNANTTVQISNCDNRILFAKGIGRVLVCVPVVLPSPTVYEIAKPVFSAALKLKCDGKPTILLFFQRGCVLVPAVKIAYYCHVARIPYCLFAQTECHFTVWTTFQVLLFHPGRAHSAHFFPRGFSDFRLFSHEVDSPFFHKSTSNEI